MIRRMVDALAGVLLRASRRPGVQKAGEALLYYDSVTRRLRLATEDGDAAVGGTGGGGGGAPTSSQYVTLATDATLTAERVLTGTANRVTVTDNGAGSTVVLDVGADVYRAGGTDVAVADGGTGASTALGARSALGLSIGSDVQAWDADLDAVAGGTWAGSTSITTLGTVTTGTWSATAIGPTKGGTGQTSYTAGDILYASASNTLSKLPAGTEGASLTIQSGAPAWVVLGVVSAIRIGATPVTNTPLTGGDAYYDCGDEAVAYIDASVP